MSITNIIKERSERLYALSHKAYSKKDLFAELRGDEKKYKVLIEDQRYFFAIV